MKNLMSFKVGKEKIEVWQLFIFIFLLLMFFVCLFLGVGLLSVGNNTVDINEEEIISDSVFISDFDNLEENYDKNKINNFKKNYQKYISDNNNYLKIDNPEFNIYGNINSSIYRVNLNKNGYFLFNNISKNYSEINELFVVDTDLSFRKLLYQVNTIVKDYSNDTSYQKFEIDDFVFFYNKKLDYFYGYEYIDGDSLNDYYFIISGEKVGFNNKDLDSIFKTIEANINISIDKSYKDTGITLSDKYKNIYINDNTNIDLSSNVLINSINNGIKNNSNSIEISLRSNLYNIKLTEIKDTLENTSKGNKKNGYLQYKFNDSKIYLKYNIKEYPEFNSSEGGVNGVLIESGDNTLLIQFDKTFLFESQEELEDILESTLGEFIR